jgi:hypothetical protein
VTNRHAEAAAAVAPTRTPQLMFVTFFSYEADVEYQPEDLQLSNQGRQMRAVKILPITSGFGRQRLAQQSQQAALYVFDEDIDYNQSLVVRYGTTDADAWARIIPKLEVERAKVRAKAGSGSL